MLRNPRFLPHTYDKRLHHARAWPGTGGLQAFSLNLFFRRNTNVCRLLLLLAVLLLFLLLLRPQPAPQPPHVSVRVQVDLDALIPNASADDDDWADRGGGGYERENERDSGIRDHEHEHGWSGSKNAEIGADRDEDDEDDDAAIFAPIRARPREAQQDRGRRNGDGGGPAAFVDLVGAANDGPRAPRPPARKKPAGIEEHTYLPNGLVQVNPAGRHPIYDLIERAETEWDEKLRTQSRTLEQAVAEYKRRYDRKPPRGFDKWWAYVKRHNVQLPDEYDQIFMDLEMFYAHTPADLRRMQQTTRDLAGTYTFHASPAKGDISVVATHFEHGSEEQIGTIRAGEQLDMLRGYGEVWTDDDTGKPTSVEAEIIAATGEWEATFGSHDVPIEFGDFDIYNERRVKARAREMTNLFKKPQMDYLGWASACPHDAPLRRQWPPVPDLPLQPHEPKTFIYDHRQSMNPCVNPDLVHTAGFLLGHYDKGPGPQEQHRLLFGICKTEGVHGDVLTVATEMWTEDVGADPEWDDKPDERLVWRGSNTGVLVTPENRWNASQRMRFVEMVNEHAARLNYSVLLPHSEDEPVGTPEPRPQAWMNHLLTDAAFTRGPVQCMPGECEKMWAAYDFRDLITQSQHNLHKYVFDIDGNGWSARFKRLITTRSMVLKTTIFPEWYMDRVQPWVHYVPVQVDLSDLYDILTFFRGDVVRGGAGGHDDLARKIATAGRQWSLRFWRRVDVVAYTWRLFLEYGRLVSDNRNEMNFDL